MPGSGFSGGVPAAPSGDALPLMSLFYLPGWILGVLSFPELGMGHWGIQNELRSKHSGEGWNDAAVNHSREKEDEELAWPS